MCCILRICSGITCNKSSSKTRSVSRFCGSESTQLFLRESLLMIYDLPVKTPLFSKSEYNEKNLTTECPFLVSAQPLSDIKVNYFVQIENKPKSTDLLTGESYIICTD